MLPVESNNIILTGTESTFKTYLSQQLSHQLGWELSPEFARTYLESEAFKSKGIDINSIPLELWFEIQNGQLKQQREYGYLSAGTRPVLFDTDGLTLYIWAKDKYNLDIRHLKLVPPGNFYLLCAPTNLPKEDPLRIDAHRRWVIHQMYVDLLNDLKVNYAILQSEKPQDRTYEAIEILKSKGFITPPC